MNKNRPYFSVLMPTYNRGHLISKAIKSVLQQTFGDLELVISNGGSTDNTKEIVAGFNDSRIRYIESEKRLSIGDNYQNALAHATGEYVSFLSDDDVFVPVTLARVKRVIDDYNAQTVAFHVSQYVHDGDYEHQIYTPANSLEIPLFTGQVSGFKSQEALRLLFSNFGFGGKTQHENFIVSYLANAVYHHTIFERLRARKKHLFATTPADMYLAGAVLSVVDTYFCLSEPLHVWSRWGGNASASPARHADNLRQHYENLLNGQKLYFVPLKAALPLNCITNAILNAKNDFDTNDIVQVDWMEYFVSAHYKLNELKSFAVNVDQEFAEFYQVLSEQPIELQTNVKAALNSSDGQLKSGLFSNTKQSVKGIIKDKMPSTLQMLKKLTGRVQNPIAHLKIVNGEENGFNDLLGAAQYINDNCLKAV